MPKLLSIFLSLFWVCVWWATPFSLGYAERVLLEQRSLYSNILVKQRDGLICLQFHVKSDLRNQSCINPKQPKKMVFAYTRMSMAALLFQPQPQAVLVVGLGGGTLPTALAELYPDAEIDALEIDPAVIDVAENYFGFKADERVRAHSLDARIWVRRATLKEQRFDLIILDAFNGDYIPEHLMTAEFLGEVKSLLSAEGVVVANTFSISRLYDHESATYAYVFGGFFNFQRRESSNRVILAPNHEVSDAELRARAAALHQTLKPYGVPIKNYARDLIKLRDADPDWDTSARILNDQFAPANLLNQQPRRPSR